MCELSDTVNRKFIDSLELDEFWEIETDTGWSPISHIHKTIQYQEYELRTESGKELICADDHIVFDENENQIFVKDCIPGLTKIITKSGIELVDDVLINLNKSHMYDISVSDDNHRFWTGDILSHNSTILDALTFVLFGKPFRKINKPQLINSTNNSDLVVEITFETGNKSYLIRRGMKPNIFEIFEDDKMINQDALNKDYQEFLETNILKMNYKTFTQIVVIGNATYMPFMKLTPYDRRSIVENLLDIDIFSKMNGILKTKISGTKEEFSDISYKLDLSKEKMRMHNSLLSDTSTNIDIQIEENNKEINRNKIQLDTKRTTIEDLQTQINNIVVNDSKISSIKSKISSMNNYSATFKEKIKIINKEVKFFDTTTSCPTCTQVIPEDFKRSTLSQRKEEYDKYTKALESCNTEIKNLSDELDMVVSSLNQINKLNLDIAQRRYEIDSIEQYIEKLTTQNVSLYNKKMEDMKKTQEEANSLREENQKLTDKRDDLLTKQHLQSIASVLLKDDGIKTKIIRHYLPVMNKIINKYLQMMDFYVNFALDENFNEVIKNKSKENFSYHSFSEGEKLRIDLAILFTWREISKMKNAANTNLLLLDEVFDSSLDATGIDDFIKILYTNKESTNTFVISHKTEFLVDKFERIYRFSKVNGFTKIAID
jgi:DNA repair exonuclease SbcCD ATPase subunit